MKQTLFLVVVLGGAACGQQPFLSGAPVSEEQVRYAIELANGPVPPQAQSETPDAGADISFEFLQVDHFERHNEQLYGLTEQNGSHFDVTVALRGKDCLADTALMHELMHVRYADSGHKNPFVWHATLTELNNKFIIRFCPGHQLTGGLL